MKKGALQISFGWLFAIMVGVVILFLAVLLATNIMKIGQKTQSAKTGEEIGILLNPLETGFESAKTTSFSLPSETRIDNKCTSSGEFGKQTIEVTQKNFGKWQETGIDVSFQNKYIFSEELEGKEFFVFSKPFEFPFKIADLIYLSPEKREYCFSDAPADIEEELEMLGGENLKLEGNCSQNAIEVCFSSSSGCDINVEENYVEKGDEIMYFAGDVLMYAGIFSDKEVYECQVKRLMARVESLAELYNKKQDSLAELGCDAGLIEDLSLLKKSAENLEDSGSLASMADVVDDLRTKNELSGCMLW